MNLKEYIEGLREFAKENPETLDMEVISSIDDEDNGFNPIIFSPSKGIHEDRDFIPFDQYDDWNRNENDTNAVCVN